MITNIINGLQLGHDPWTIALLVVTLVLCIYPIIGAMYWFWGAIAYTIFRKRDDELASRAELTTHPFITIMVPAHNEEVIIESTLDYLLHDLNYDHYEVLVMDDGSTDQTPAILKRLQKTNPRLRVVRIDDNQGKAHAFNVGMFFARGEYILSNDADTLPEPDALLKYMRYFMSPRGVNYAAVTANMDVYNRTTLLGKSQTVEFSSIVGIIKRSQTAINNTMYAYSGANTMYRKRFLINAGGFRQDRATEDISIAWDHTFMNVVPRFAPDIVFHMNVPETVHDLFRQRNRWAQGGTEVWLTNFTRTFADPWRNRYILPMVLDTTFSLVWSFFFVITTAVFILLMLYYLGIGNYERIFHGLVMSMIFVTFQLIAGLFQVLAALILDFHGTKLRYILFSPVYLLFTWVVNPLTIIITFHKAVRTILGFGKGTWKSPQRRAN